MPQPELHADILVVGAGNAGLCAALAAAQAGADVLVLEKAPRLHRGGNTQFVSRYRFAFPSQDELCRVAGIPAGLARRLALDPYPADRFFTDMMRVSRGQADPQWTWHSAALDSGEYLRALWAAGVSRSRAVVQAQLSRGEAAALSQTHADWQLAHPVSLRWVLVHLIEEYARHNGHADLIRESIDGQTGD